MIIDCIDKLELSDDRAGNYANELSSLGYLAQGLWFLNGQVQRLEAKITEQVGKDKQVFMLGNVPQLKAVVPQGLVACAFHWYAVSVCNYVRMVGWLAYGQEPIDTIKYVKHVIPAVYVWRNKVAAHFAKIAPRKEDNPADLAISVMWPISFDDDAFYAHSYRLTQSTSGKSHTSRQDMRWSLTHTHRDLIPRY